MRTKVRKRSLLEVLKGHLLSIVFFIVIFGLFIGGIRSAEANSAAEEKRVLEESINKAVVSCYALEGAYPDSIEHLEENYGLVYDKDKYRILYSVFASNLMPEISVVSMDELDKQDKNPDDQDIILY